MGLLPGEHKGQSDRTPKGGMSNQIVCDTEREK